MPKKKRNKKYRGEDAADAPVNVTRIKATKKSPIKEYWEDNKLNLLGTAVQVLLVGTVALLLYLLFSWIV